MYFSMFCLPTSSAIWAKAQLQERVKADCSVTVPWAFSQVTVAVFLPEPYSTSRHTGSFLLIDPQSGTNLAAGMIRGDQAFSDDAAVPLPDTLNWTI